MTFPLVAVYCGIDVGKSAHHAVALTLDGQRVFDKPLPQDETRLRELFTDLGQHGAVMVTVDQPRTIGALPVAIALDMGLVVTYLPGLTMRRVADLYPGNAKTDARDAFIIADTARTLPGTLRAITIEDEQMADLRVLAGLDDDLAGEVTRITNQIRGLLTDIHPALERAIGPHLDHSVGPAILARFGGPNGLNTANKKSLHALIRKHAQRAHQRIYDAITTALREQHVVVPGSGAADQVLKLRGKQLLDTTTARADLGHQFEQALAVHPFGPVLTSMPGIGARTGIRILLEVVDPGAFATAGHLAAYAGLAPRTHRSGTSIRGEHQQRAGNKRLKKAIERGEIAISSPSADSDRNLLTGRQCKSAPARLYPASVVALHLTDRPFGLAFRCASRPGKNPEVPGGVAHADNLCWTRPVTLAGSDAIGAVFITRHETSVARGGPARAETCQAQIRASTGPSSEAPVALAALLAATLPSLKVIAKG